VGPGRLSRLEGSIRPSLLGVPGIGIARKRMLPCNRADRGCVALTGQHYLTGNGADFAMAFKLEAICGTDEGSNANDGVASCWCGFPHA
jgi:hypothetical protein